MSGVGLDPTGSFPVGLEKATSAARRGGTPEIARMIDPKTKDFVADDETSRLRTWTKTQQRVYLAVLTTLNSAAAVPEMGSKLTSIRKIDSKFIHHTKTEIRRALSSLVDEKTIVIRTIDVNVTDGGRAEILLTYLDLTNQESEETLRFA